MLLAPPAFESCIQHPGTAFQAELRWKKLKTPWRQMSSFQNFLNMKEDLLLRKH